jgi:hypothetical protein
MLLLARLFLFAYVEVLLSFILAMFSSSFIYGFIIVLNFYSINLLIMLLRSFKNLSHRVSCSFSCQHKDFVFCYTQWLFLAHACLKKIFTFK